MGHSRRSFLKSAGAITAAVSAGSLSHALPDGAGIGPDEALAAGRPLAAAAGRFALELNGQVVGDLFAVQGGNPFGSVVEFRSGADLAAHKHIGGVKYEDITVMVGLEMAPAFWTWVSNMVAGDPAHMNGAVVIADGEFNILRRLEFHNALVTEVQIPKLDAASHDTAYVSVRLRPESTQWKAGGGTLVVPTARQKQWLVSNFRLQVGTLPCSRVSKVESLTVRQEVTEFREGTGGATQLLPGKLEYPNLTITFSALDAASWQTFFNDFVLNGNNGDSQELGGRLEFLGPDLTSVLATVQLFHLGIFRLGFEEVEEPPSIDIRRYRADLYSEGASLAVGSRG